MNNPATAQQMVAYLRLLVRQEFDRLTAQTRYGLVFGDPDTVNRKVDVILYGQDEPSPGFSYGALTPRMGDRVRVFITTKGDRYVDEILGRDATLDVSLRGIVAIPNYGDLVAEAVFPFDTGDIHVNGVAWDGRTLICGTYTVWPTGSRIWTSIDEGRNWMNVTPAGVTIEEAVTFVPLDPGEFLMSGSVPSPGSAIWRSSNSGRTWLNRVPSSGFPTDHGQTFLATPSGVILAATIGEITAGTARIYRSTDKGDTWTKVYDGTAGKTSIRQMCLVADDVIVAGVYGASPNQTEIIRSTDAGLTWAVVQTIGSTDIYALTSLGDGVVLAGTHPNGKVYRSTDAGATWVQGVQFVAGSGSGSSVVMGLTAIGDAVIAFANLSDASHRAYASRDRGETWTHVADLTPGWHVHQPVAIDPRTIVGIETMGTGVSRARRFLWYG